LNDSSEESHVADEVQEEEFERRVFKQPDPTLKLTGAVNGMPHALFSFKDMRARKIANYNRRFVRDERSNVRYVDDDFEKGEVLILENDVYSLTIAANLTKAVPPMQLNFSIRLCVTVFIM